MVFPLSFEIRGREKLTDVPIDVVTQYCFGESDHRIEADGFDPSFHHTSFSAGTANTMMRNNNWMLKLTQTLPEKFMMNMSPEFSSFVTLRRVRNPLKG